MMTTPNTQEAVSQSSAQPAGNVQPVLRAPNLNDAKAVHALITASPPLDVNSVYVYLLLAHHFTDTCVVAELNGEILGFVSAYVPPKTPDVLFVWQVAVHERGRGLGLGKSMLQEIMRRPGMCHIKYVETTVGPDNAASRGMFASLARNANTEINETALFEGHHFGEQAHEDERLLRIGPFAER